VPGTGASCDQHRLVLSLPAYVMRVGAGYFVVQMEEKGLWLSGLLAASACGCCL